MTLDLNAVRNRAALARSITQGPNAVLRALNSADDVPLLLDELAAVEQDRDRAHAAGFAEAVAMLRDDSRYSNWWSAVPPKPGKPTGRYWDATARGHLADYLETVVLPLPGAEHSGTEAGQ